MFCDRCKKNPASVYITKMVNDQKTEYKLCVECAQKEQFFPSGMGGHISVENLLKGFFGTQKEVLLNKEQENITCPVCGMTMLKLADKGRFGCSECYKLFGDATFRTIKRIHGGKRHIGKVPKRTNGALRLKRKLSDMRTRLEEHVIKEEYEEAAKLRDEIRALEKESVASTEENNDAQ